ncbi:MAG: hypothetical protein AB7P02_12915 [Alphaproteobacteria bacterium]
MTAATTIAAQSETPPPMTVSTPAPLDIAIPDARRVDPDVYVAGLDLTDMQRAAYARSGVPGLIAAGWTPPPGINFDVATGVLYIARKPRAPAHRLTPAEAAAIKKRLADGATYTDVATFFDVPVQSVRRIAAGRTFVDTPEPAPPAPEPGIPLQISLTAGVVVFAIVALGLALHFFGR